MSAQPPPELVTVTIDGQELQAPEGPGDGGDRARRWGSRSRSSATSRGSARRSALAGCASARSRGSRSSRPPAPSRPRTALVLRTAATSEKASDGQNAILEFILLNHPLDCPDCDKGGECPLQDLTFRFGPGSTRMQFSKRTFDKPIPISPLIALDRERCILCYRCTRFSESVSEDGQLVAVNRGASSVIATFEDEPYRAPLQRQRGRALSGRARSPRRRTASAPGPGRSRTCPRSVGSARPAATSGRRPGRERWRASSPGTTPRSTRAGSATRGASPTTTCAPRTASARRSSASAARLRGHDLRGGARRRRGRPARGGVSVVLAFSGDETNEQAAALARLVRDGLGGRSPLLPDDWDPGLSRIPCAALRYPRRRRLPRAG